MATPRKTDGQRGGRGDVLQQMRGYKSTHTSASPEAVTIASMLLANGLSGTAALPITYGWMMGFPPGWLARALRSAALAGRLQLHSSSKPSATRSSRKSPKRSAGPSSE
jgi:hypothetical protein